MDATDTKTIHVGLKYVLPEDQRDRFGGLPDDVKATWDPSSGRQDAVGEKTEYTLHLPVELAEELKADAPAITNVAYIVDAQGVYPHGDVDDVTVLSDAQGPVSFPEPATLDYMGLTGVLDADGGKNVVYIHLDTGFADWQRREYGDRIVGFRNYTDSGGGAQDAQDRQGHGSMTLSLLMAAPQARAFVAKVLGDNGSGSSAGIVKAIRNAADYARANPGYHFILTGSLGGGYEQFQPYIDACNYAEAAGVMCRWSAGNGGQPRISAPANWHPDRSSIAFDRKTDLRANFSDHNSVAGAAADGVQVLMRDLHGRYVRANGTSFSLPVWVLGTACIVGRTGRGVFEVNTVELANCRDTSEPAMEEGHGLLDFDRVLEKLAAPVPVEPGVVRVGCSGLSPNRSRYYGKELVIYEKFKGKPARDLWRCTPIPQEG